MAPSTPPRREPQTPATPVANGSLLSTCFPPTRGALRLTRCRSSSQTGQGLVRAGFRALLESQDGLRVAAEAGTPLRRWPRPAKQGQTSCSST